MSSDTTTLGNQHHVRNTDNNSKPDRTTSRNITTTNGTSSRSPSVVSHRSLRTKLSRMARKTSKSSSTRSAAMIPHDMLSFLDPSKLVRKPSGGYAQYAHSAAPLSRRTSPRSRPGSREVGAQSEGGGTNYVVPTILQQISQRLEVSSCCTCTSVY